MKPTGVPATKIAKIIAAEIEINFMNVGRMLRQLQDENPEGFVETAKQAGINRRHAYALARIALQFSGLELSDDRLHKIGWAKLAIIGRHLTNKNANQLLDLAEQFTCHELEIYFKGEKPRKGARAMLLHLHPKEDQRFRALLVEWGAKPSGNGLTGKEDALSALMYDIENAIRTNRL